MRKVIIFISFLLLLQTTLSVNLMANTELLTVTTDSPGLVEGYVVNAEESRTDYIELELLDRHDQIIAITYTDENGFYQFENIALGDYQLQVKIVDKVSERFDISITADEASYSDIDFEIRSSEVVIAQQATIIEELLEHDIILTPNPTFGNSTLLLSSRLATNAELSIVNSSGEVVYLENYSLVRGPNSIFIPSSHYEAGIYYICLKIGKVKYTKILVKL